MTSGVGADDHAALLIVGAGEVATLAGGVRRGAQQDDAAVLAPGAAVAVVGEAIAAVGSREEVERRLRGLGLSPETVREIDAEGGTVTPGLIDPHTHLVFAGTRERELRMRQRGAGYLEILQAGGGILSTVEATRAATDEELVEHAATWLARMAAHGVTTVEAKSGYGLDTVTELRLLRAARLAAERVQGVEVMRTFLGAHAVPQELRTDPDGVERYVRQVIEEQLPAVADSGEGAAFCDVFCEAGVFTPEQSRRVLDAGVRHGLRPRLHADELHASGGAVLATDVGAVSADHLAAVDAAGVEALARVAPRTVATLLPATTLFLLLDRFAPARALIEAGVPVALGTDFNPGTSPTSSLPLVMSLACVRLRMSPTEALVAVTVNAAAALALDATHGSIEPGKQADLVIWPVPSHELIPYWLGADLRPRVIKRGVPGWEAG